MDTLELLVCRKYELFDQVWKVQLDEDCRLPETLTEFKLLTRRPVQDWTDEIPHTSDKSTVSEIFAVGMVSISMFIRDPM